MYRVMVVDDDEDMRLMVARWLGKIYDVMTAASGEEAYEMLKQGKVDLVLLDSVMPGLGGSKTLEKLKDDPDTADIPVIFFTGDEDEEVISHAMESGAASYIKKSSGKKILMDAVADHFAGQS